MTTRLNNLSARLLMNEWLVDRGQNPISGDLDYIGFAIELRRRIAKTVVAARFVERADACRYIREMALTHHPRLHNRHAMRAADPFDQGATA